jgi:RecJ-like exonuclease
MVDLTPEQLAKLQFEAEEAQRKQVGGSGDLGWIPWTWEEVSGSKGWLTKEGREFRIAVAKRVLVMLEAGLCPECRGEGQVTTDMATCITCNGSGRALNK